MNVTQQILYAVLDQVRKIALIVLPIMARLGFSLHARIAVMGAIGVAALIRMAAQYFSPEPA